MPDPDNIKTIFLAAADKPPAQRAAYLAQACGGDNDLRRRIEALLKAHDDTGGWLGEPATPTSDYPGFAAPSVEELAPLFPQLEILELLGRGGMGAVYKARQKNLDRLVALKILPHDSGDAGFAERFTREARMLAKLNHPGIVAVHDFGTANGLYWFVMEFVDGVNLRQAKKAGTLTPAVALAIVPKICEALQFAHDAGVVHRDIKPENVLLDSKGRVKIADFGLAKLIDPERSHLTGTHQAMGTPHYMAPEQWERPLEVDHRADIYSLGVVFYELLTGELPLGRFAPPSQKVQIDVRLDDVVLRTLEKEPERRYQQVSEVKTDVERIGQSASAPRAIQKMHTPPSASRPSFFWYVIVPTLTLAVLSGAVMFLTWEDAGRRGGQQGFETQVSKSAVLVVNIAIVAFVVLASFWFWRRRQRPVTESPRLVPAPPAPFLRGVVAPCAVLGTIAVLIAVGISRFYQGPPRYREDLTAAAVILGTYGTLALFALLTVRWFARQRQKSVLRSLADSARFLRLNSLSTWAILVCILGVANSFIPWTNVTAIVSGRQTQQLRSGWYTDFNQFFDQCGPMTNALFPALGLFLLITSGLNRVNPWRAGLILLTGVAAMALAIIYVNGATGNPNRVPFNPQFWFAINVLPGPYVAMGLSAALLLIGALDLRGWLVTTSRVP